jgi:hypothetical protein
MYNHGYPIGSVATGGTIAALYGWNLAGWMILAASVLVAGGMTIMRLRRARG